MKKRSLFCLFLLMVLLTSALAQTAQAQGPLPPDLQTTPVGTATGRAVAVQFGTNPGEVRVGAPFTTQITLQGQPVTGCQGIPGQPLDLVFVVDNSGSAGDGSEASNLGRTRALLQAFVTIIDQKVYVQPTYPNPQALRSRVGLVASRVGSSGTELYRKNMTETVDEVQQSIATLPVGGDTDQVEGFKQAVEELKARRGNARPVVVLMLHDNLPIQGERLATAVNEARTGDKNLDVYLFSNTRNIKDADQITPAMAQKVVALDRFAPDPRPDVMRRLFIQMSNGSTGANARDIKATLTWAPAGAVTASAPNPATAASAGDKISWTVPTLASGQSVTLSHVSNIIPAALKESFLEPQLEVSYVDCNGYVKYIAPETFRIKVQQAPPTPTVMPSALPSAPVATSPPPVTGNTAAPTQTPSGGAAPVLTAPVTICPPDFCRPLLLSLGLGSLPDWAQCLILILLLLLLLLLLYLLWRLINWLRNRKPTQKQTGGPTTGVGGIPANIPVGERELAWLTRLTVQRKAIIDPKITESPNFQETLLIGIGPVGREVLSQVAESLNGRFGRKWPAGVRLLQIDVRMNPDTPVPAEPPPGLSAEQWITLDPKLEIVEDNLKREAEKWQFWRWFSGTKPNYERSLGRMALFFDLRNGTQNSRFWMGIDGALKRLESPVVKVIGSTFDDTSSGMLVDVLRLVHIIAKEESMDAQLWLCGPVGREWSARLKEKGRVRPDEQAARTLATLRELERFQRNETVSYTYVPDTSAADMLRKDYSFAPVRSVFLFEPSDTRSAPEDDVMASMADLLLASFNLSVHQALAQLYQPSLVPAGTRANRIGDGYVTSLGSFTVRRPVLPMEEALAWRLVRDSLFETAVGALPQETVEPSNGAYQPLTGKFDEEKLAVSSASADAQAIIAQFQAVGGQSFGALFGLVRNRLNDLLNGEQSGGLPVLHRRNSLENALAWLEQLTKELRYYGLDQETAATMLDLRTQLTAWKDALTGVVKPQVETRLDTARSQLNRLRTQPPRSWDLDENLEWRYYRKYVREALGPGATLDNNPLLWLGSRFGWEVQYLPGSNRFALRLLVPPADFEYYPGIPVSDHAVYSNQATSDPGRFLNSLFNLALPKIRAQLGTTALEIAEQGNISEWLKAARPRLNFNQMEAGEKMGKIDEKTLLVAEPKEQDRIDRVREKLLTSPYRSSTSVDDCAASDPGSVTIITAISYVPFSTLAVFNDKTWRSNPVPATHYVWLPEQQAAQVERNAAPDGGTPRRLSALFLGWLARDEALLRTFSLGCLYGIFKIKAGKWILPGLEPGVEADSVSEVLRALMTEQTYQHQLSRTRDAILQKWEMDAEAARQKVDENNRRMVHLRDFREDVVRPLAQSDTPLEQDFGAYLLGLVEAEKNR